MISISLYSYDAHLFNLHSLLKTSISYNPDDDINNLFDHHHHINDPFDHHHPRGLHYGDETSNKIDLFQNISISGMFKLKTGIVLIMMMTKTMLQDYKDDDDT